MTRQTSPSSCFPVLHSCTLGLSHRNAQQLGPHRCVRALRRQPSVRARRPGTGRQNSRLSCPERGGKGGLFFCSYHAVESHVWGRQSLSIVYENRLSYGLLVCIHFDGALVGSYYSAPGTDSIVSGAQVGTNLERPFLFSRPTRPGPFPLCSTLVRCEP